MPRTKDDFLNYARRFSAANAAEQRLRVQSSEGNSDRIDIRNETPISDVFGTNENYDGTATISSSNSEGVWRTNEGNSSIEQGENGGESSSYYGEYGTSSTNGYIDIPIRKSNVSPHQFDKPIQPSPVRAVTRSRTTMFDKMTNLGKKFAREPKDKNKPIVKDSISGRRLLTIAEASATRSGLIQLLLWSSENLDHGIAAITRGHQEVEIWSNLEYADAEILVDAFSDAAQKSERVARAYRQVVEYHKKIKVGIILAPRIYKSIVYTITTGIDLRV